jgi:hypothetical protein
MAGLDPATGSGAVLKPVPGLSPGMTVEADLGMTVRQAASDRMNPLIRRVSNA